MSTSFTPSPQQKLWIERWQRFSAAVVRYFHAYAGWLVGISWKRFVLLSLALLIGVNVLKNLPPFTWRISEQIEDHDAGAARRHAKLEADARKAAEKARRAAESNAKKNAKGAVLYEIKVDERGVRIQPVRTGASAASAASAASDADGEAHAGDGDGDAPAIAITMRDPRCSMVNFDPDSASPAPEVLKAVVRANQNTAGIYGTVTRIGRLAVGQVIRLHEATGERKRG